VLQTVSCMYSEIFPFLQQRISAHNHRRIWDTATGQCLQTLVHEDNAPVVSVRFSPNGKYVLAWTLDGSIRLWDYVEGLCKKTYQGHENKKYSIGGAFGVYGKEAFVVSGSEDGSIVLWDVKSKNILQRLDGHDGVALWVETHPYLDLIVSCGLDAKVKIWINEDVKEEEATGDEETALDIVKERTPSPDLKHEIEE
jgi:COMPASS component SWD3